MSPRPLTIPEMVKSNWPSAVPHGQNSRSWKPSSSAVEGDINDHQALILRLYSRDSFEFGLTAALEPLLQGLGYVEGQPFVLPLVADKAGGEVAGRGLQALVQLHPLLVLYSCLFDEHAQLGTS